MHEPDICYADATGPVWAECTCGWNSIVVDREEDAWTHWEHHHDRELEKVQT